MVRNVALGLLIAGTTSAALANSSTAKTEANRAIVRNFSSVSSACIEPSDNCSEKLDRVRLGIHGDLWLQDIAKSILPNSPFLICDRQSTARQRQPWNNGLTLDSLGKLASSTCGFTWQHQLDRQFIALESNRASSKTLELNRTQNYKTTPKFPQLKRTSLIVDFPLTNSTFVPRSTKLANPAPATKRIASPFGWRNRPYSNQLQFHQGIDYGAPYGSTVVSVGNGIVTQVVSGCADFGNLFCGGQLGNWIEVDHGNGIIGTYGHLKRSSISVQPGMRVSKNQPIAQVGSSGWSTGAHLDFRLKVNGKHENPAKYVMAIESDKNRQ